MFIVHSRAVFRVPSQLLQFQFYVGRSSTAIRSTIKDFIQKPFATFIHLLLKQKLYVFETIEFLKLLKQGLLLPPGIKAFLQCFLASRIIVHLGQ